MFGDIYSAAGRAAEYLGETLENSPFEYIPNYPPNFVGFETGSASSVRFDSFTDLCRSAIQGPVERVHDALNGGGFNDTFYVVQASFEGASDEIALNWETPAATASLREAVAWVKVESENNASRVRSIEICKDERRVAISFVGGGEVSIYQMRICRPAQTHRKVAERAYDRLRYGSGKPFAALKTIPGLRSAPCFENINPKRDDDPFLKSLGAERPDWIPFPIPERKPITEDEAPNESGLRDSHLCMHPRGLARELQELWKEGGGGKIALSKCQEAVARYLGAKNWNHLISIDPNRYWLPVMLSIGDDPSVVDSWDEHHYYRNGIEGLAAFGEFVDSVEVDCWSFGSSISRSGALTVSARFGDKFVSVRPFYMFFDDPDVRKSVPAILENIDDTSFLETAMRVFGVGLSRDEYFARRDERDGSLTLVLDGMQIRRYKGDGWQQYVEVENMRKDSSCIESRWASRVEDVYLHLNESTNCYEIFDSDTNGARDKLMGYFGATITRPQKLTLEKILQRYDTFEELDKLVRVGRIRRNFDNRSYRK